jgi:catechol 2,3-dioxygenase-like lactoylglutathione lyase family enzyme
VTVESVEVGLVSSDRGVVDFLADVFQLPELDASETSVGTLHRLLSPGAVIKVMVPKDLPTDPDRRPFLAVKGLRYLTLSVTDLDQVLERCVAHGGTVVLEATQHKPGSRLAVIMDLDGNTIEITEAE